MTDADLLVVDPVNHPADVEEGMDQLFRLIKEQPSGLAEPSISWKSEDAFANFGGINMSVSRGSATPASYTSAAKI